MNADAIRSLPDHILEALVTCPTTGALTAPYARAEIERRPATGVVTVVVDLDGLKVANDTLGHAAGDALLRRAVDVIRSAIRPGDLCYRAGGDEFVAIVATADPHTDAPGIEQRLRDALDGRNGVTASVGAAPGINLVDADARMYDAKRNRSGA